MNVQNIKNASVLLQTAGGKVNPGQGNVSTESDLSLQTFKLSEAQENQISSGKSSVRQNGENALQFDYPPFFPIGNTQGIFSMLAEPTPKSETSESAQTRNDDKEDGGLVSERFQAAADKGVSISEKASSGPGRKDQSGSFLDLKA